ncbi:MAG: HNH endonuclease signature motif containing protein [Cypionkella sp.]|uniref:HNH endonuclease n=1 Tax=Cypionkella sp. TaxID=2811411 RepID=UPI002730537D|nr:HNH endonuclease signature motif containing protein [Cypionkella sp.]MDP2047607.1 HNH endonuclease signature motif containing protein [Cypionkella sp.]
MSRAVEEWVGKTDDTAIPPRVKLRVFEAHGGICYLTKRKILPGDDWDCDHILALCNGGENRESNLAPALKAAHRTKTVADVKKRAKIDRVRKKHLGLHKPKHIMPGSKDSKWRKPLNGPAVRRDKGDS